MLAAQQGRYTTNSNAYDPLLFCSNDKQEFTINGDTREDQSTIDIGDQDPEDVYRDILIYATGGMCQNIHSSRII